MQLKKLIWIFALILLVMPINARDAKLSLLTSPVYASGCFNGCTSRGTNYDKNNINDGIFYSASSDDVGWIAENGDTTKANISIDLGSVYTITAIAVWEPGFNTYDREPIFGITYSSDNTSWTDLYTSQNLQNGAASNWTVESGINYTAFDARYVMMRNVQGESNEARVGEFEIWGTNISTPPTLSILVNNTSPNRDDDINISFVSDADTFLMYNNVTNLNVTNTTLNSFIYQIPYSRTTYKFTVYATNSDGTSTNSTIITVPDITSNTTSTCTPPSSLVLCNGCSYSQPAGIGYIYK